MYYSPWGRKESDTTKQLNTHTELILSSLMAQWVKNLPAVQETQKTPVRSLGREYPLEKEMVTHSSILA